MRGIARRFQPGRLRDHLFGFRCRCNSVAKWHDVLDPHGLDSVPQVSQVSAEHRSDWRDSARTHLNTIVSRPLESKDSRLRLVASSYSTPCFCPWATELHMRLRRAVELELTGMDVAQRMGWGGVLIGFDLGHLRACLALGRSENKLEIRS